MLTHALTRLITMSPAICPALSEFGGGLCAYVTVIFEMMSYMNIHACTAGRNMNMPRHLTMIADNDIASSLLCRCCRDQIATTSATKPTSTTPTMEQVLMEAECIYITSGQ